MVGLKTYKKVEMKKTSYKYQQFFTVKNIRGLHTRPSTELVKCANHFKSKITLRYQKLEVNAKSILGILMLAAPRGAKIEVVAEGVDAKEAVEAILVLAKREFNVKY